MSIIKSPLKYLLTFIFIFTFTLYSAESQRPKIGLVLSGGGAKGVAHVGVIKIIEELGIPIDYITGTSMGAVIGSLYASGYNHRELDSIATTMDWDALFNDKLPRDKISIEEKDETERYILEIAIKDYGLSLPQGLIAGQKLSQKLSTLLLPVHEISDFLKLPIPFKCIATDIETGKAVILDKGNLAISVRASMAIPSIFNPIEINDKLLVDGGIIRNFPVIDAKEMGADIIIGVDVGGHLFKKDQLNSLVSIMQQTVAFRGNAVDQQQKELCNILITPNIHGIDASSFSKVDSIITRGEIAAQKVYPALKALADSLKQFKGKDYKFLKPIMPHEFIITDIKVSGNHNVPEKMILQKIFIKKNEAVSTDQIIDNVQKIYSTKFFKNVFFEIIPDSLNNGNTLKLEVVEENVNRIKLGIHYDNDLKSALLLNFTTRNLYLNGSKFSIDTRLSENPEIRASYFYYTGFKPDIGLGLITGYSDLNMAQYQFGDQRVGTSIFRTFYTDGILNTILAPSLSLSFGMRYEISNMSVDGMIQGSKLGLPYDLPIRIGVSEKINLFNLYTTLNFDNINSRYFTKEGSKLLFRLEFTPQIKNSDLSIKIYVDPDDNNPIEVKSKNNYENFLRLSMKMQHSVPISRYISLTGQIRGGFTNKNSIPIFYNFMLGGISRETRNIIPFIGARLLEYTNSNYISSLFSFQYEPIHNKFIIIKGNVGYLASDFNDFFKMSINDKNFIYGYGLTLGMNSLMGPLSLTFMTKDNPKNILTYINIGYNF